jgi:hypothetical protein
MNTFFQWIQENGHKLPVEIEAEDADASENTHRAGVSHNYPDAYVRAQYPHKYFNPTTATADGKLAKKMG